METWNFSTVCVVEETSASTALGRTVMTGVPFTLFDETVKEPPKIDWVALASAERSTASVMIPLSSRTANRPAISFPRADEAIKIAFAECACATWAIASTAAEIPFFSKAESSTTNTFSIGRFFNCSAIESALPGFARTTAVTGATLLPRVASSPAVFATFPCS